MAVRPGSTAGCDGARCRVVSGSTRSTWTASGTLDRRPGCATGCSPRPSAPTPTGRRDPGAPAGRPFRRQGGRSMKALGRGDRRLRLPRRRGGARRRPRGAPRWSCHRRPPTWPAAAGVVALAHLAHPHRPVPGGGRGRVAEARGRRPVRPPVRHGGRASGMQPVLTVSEMRRSTPPPWPTPRDAWWAGPAPAVAVAALGSWVAATAAGSWWWPARATTGPTAGWPPSGPAPAGGPGDGGRGGRRPPTAAPCDLVVDAAYGTGFRGEYRAPRGAPGHAGPGRGHPLGGRRGHRGGRGAAPWPPTAR